MANSPTGARRLSQPTGRSRKRCGKAAVIISIKRQIIRIKLHEEGKLIRRIKGELERTQSHMDHTTRQLRHNIKKSMCNSRIAALVIWLDMLRNVKGETFQRKVSENM